MVVIADRLCHRIAQMKQTEFLEQIAAFFTVLVPLIIQ